MFRADFLDDVLSLLSEIQLNAAQDDDAVFKGFDQRCLRSSSIEGLVKDEKYLRAIDLVFQSNQEYLQCEQIQNCLKRYSELAKNVDPQLFALISPNLHLKKVQLNELDFVFLRIAQVVGHKEMERIFPEQIAVIAELAKGDAVGSFAQDVEVQSVPRNTASLATLLNGVATSPRLTNALKDSLKELRQQRPQNKELINLLQGRLNEAKRESVVQRSTFSSASEEVVEEITSVKPLKTKHYSSLLEVLSAKGERRTELRTYLASADLSLEDIKQGLCEAVKFGKVDLLKMILENNVAEAQISSLGQAARNEFFFDLNKVANQRQRDGKDASAVKAKIQEFKSTLEIKMSPPNHSKSSRRKVSEIPAPIASIKVNDSASDLNPKASVFVPQSEEDLNDFDELAREIDKILFANHPNSTTRTTTSGTLITNSHQNRK